MLVFGVRGRGRRGVGIRFDGVASTAKACPGIDTRLGRLASAEADDGVLIVRDESGAELARLDRAD